jgi:hypothetical protein
MEDEATLRVSWVLPASQVRAEVSAITKAKGVVESQEPFVPSNEELDRYAHAAFEPLTVLVFSFALAFLAEQLSRFGRNLKHGGLIIDLRTTPISVREERALEAGTIYVVSKQGMEEIASPKPLDIVDAIKAVIKAT